MSGFETWKDIIDTLINFIGFAVIFYSIKTFFLKRKQNYFLVVNNFINKYQENFAGVKTFDERQVLKYIDLVNEEVFYISNDYLPFVIAVEWIDGILDILPIIKKESQIFTNPNSPMKNEINYDTLKLYPRIRNTFKSERITEKIDLTAEENLELRKLVIEDIFVRIFPDKRNIRKETRSALRKIYHNI